MSFAPFDGDLDDYQRYLLDESKRLRELAKVQAVAKVEAPAPAPIVLAQPTVSKGSIQNLKKKLQDAELKIATLQKEQSALHVQLSQALPAAELAQAAKRLKSVDSELALAEEQWLALGETLEASV
jgi:ATP-binding cassette, subfamily F, member 3